MNGRRWALYAAITAVSWLAHLKGIASPMLDYHYHRQANTAAIAENYHEDGLPFLRPRIDWEGASNGRAATELPLYMWLVGLFWPLFGWGDIWGRLLSCAFSAATAVVLFRFLERDGPERGWMDTGPAFCSALFFSLLPVEIYFGRTVQPEALALFATVAAFWTLDLYLSARGPARWACWGASVFLAFLAAGHKLPYLYLLGVCAALAVARRGRDAFRDPALWAYAPGVVALVFAWYKYASSGLYVVPTQGSAYLDLLRYKRFPYFFWYQVFSRLPELALTYTGAVFFVAGARELVFRQGLWFLGAWWLCVLADVLLGGEYAFRHEYPALPWAPINAAFMGMGFWVLKERAAGVGRWARAGLVVLALGVPVHAALRIGHWYRINYPFLLGLRPVVERLSAKDDLFLCNQRAASVYLYFIGRRGWSWDLGEAGVDRLGEVDAAIAKGAKFFLTERRGLFDDPAHPIAASFFSRFPVVHDGDGVLIFQLSSKSPKS